MIVYKGVKDNSGGPKTVFKVKDGVPKILNPARSINVFNHSPDGFQWGYQGSGPAQLALGLLLDVTDDIELSKHLHQEFKRAFVANFLDEWELDETDIKDWINRHDNRELQTA